MTRTVDPRAMLHRTLRNTAIAMLLGASMLASAATFVSVTIAPPPLPVYAQPLIPAPGYIWIPGYWAYGPEGYFWVPGTWVLPPAVGLLWTPGYWGWRSGAYIWNAGYWGPRVGYYGGVNYGFGYFGSGYHGGYWRGGSFYYNRAVNNVNVNVVRTTYNTTVHTTTVNRVSYNGGPGGVHAEPTSVERQAMNERHVSATSMQVQHQNAAATNRALFASENRGRPAIAATPQPGAFNQSGVTPARESAARTTTRSTASGSASPAAPGTLPGRSAPPSNAYATTAPTGSESKQGRAKSSANASPGTSPQGYPTGNGGRNAKNAQVATPSAMPPRGQGSHPANAAMNPHAATPHPQGATQGAVPGGGQGHAAKSRESGEPKGEGQRHLPPGSGQPPPAALNASPHRTGGANETPPTDRSVGRTVRARGIRWVSRTRRRAGRRHRAPTHGSASRASPTGRSCGAG